MKKLTFEELNKTNNIVIYKYIRGSHAYGLEKPDGTSDIDTAMVYLEPMEQLLGLGLDYQEQISDEKQDNVAYSLKKFMNMLLSSNPTVLESLFIPDKCVLYEHPIMTEIKKHRDKFITKACFKPFLGYSYQQISKCRGLNKRFLLEKVERKQVLDFAYTFHKQGSTKIEYWLEHRGLNQKYCGLVNIPNMDSMYAVFYDWGNHFLNENVTESQLFDAYILTNENETVELIHHLKNNQLNDNEQINIENRIKLVQLGNMARFICETYNVKFFTDAENSFKRWFNNQKPIGYKGMVGEDKLSNELRLSSVAEGALPVCQMHYDPSKYSSHCRKYREQKEWEEKRNPERYKENCGKQFDRKNVAHAVRLLHMGIEIVKGKGFNVDRTSIDRDFIMNIRLGNTSYEEIISYIESKKDEMEDLMKKSTLPDSIDIDFVNDLLLDIRKKQILNLV